jgi:hypothetical protein
MSPVLFANAVGVMSTRRPSTASFSGSVLLVTWLVVVRVSAASCDRFVHRSRRTPGVARRAGFA